MDRRYQDPLVTALWGPEWTYDAWWKIEQAIIRAQIENDIVDEEEASPLVNNPSQPSFHLFTSPTFREIDEEEARTKHDVAAFVNVMREWWGEPHARWIHYGVTSSDLVDTAQALRFAALGPILNASTTGLIDALAPWQENRTPVLGRTHGQAAEPTSIAVRASHWSALVAPAYGRLLGATLPLRMAKIAGPVGTYAYNPPEVEIAVAAELKLMPQIRGASQISPRGNLAHWANCVAEFVHACGKIAMDLRLMNLLGEAAEPKAEGQVGSSSMAHKNNPIRAEQITGLQRVVAGYASMLQPLDLWLERDISNSSVERIAVPDLWHLLLHVVGQTAELLRRTEPNEYMMQHNIDEACNQAWVAKNTITRIENGETAEEARANALEDDMCGSYADPAWFTRQHPSHTRRVG